MHITLERKRGMKVSGMLHGLLLLLFIVGLPRFFFTPEPAEPAAITVDILPIAAMSNVRPSEQQPEEKQDEEKKEDKKDDAPDEKKAEAKKESPKVDTSKEQTPPPEEKLDAKKEEIKKEPEKKEVKKEDPLDAILKSVKDTASTETKQTSKPAETASTSPTRSRSNNFDPNSPQAISIRDAVHNQIYKCWNIPAGAKDADKLIIPVEVDYDQTGMPIKVALASAAQAKYDSDSFFRAAADSAMRAVRACAPLQGMPADSFSIWQYVNLNFNPKDMVL